MQVTNAGKEQKNETMTAEIIMVQPRTSVTGSFVRMIPLGVLYAASKVVREGFRVRIFDARIKPSSDEHDLEQMITANTVIIGISVMSGVSLNESIRLSRAIKARHPHITIVWGGPHPTFSPMDALQEASVDYVVCGYGSEPFYQLVTGLLGDPAGCSLGDIRGLYWRDEQGQAHHNEVVPAFELIDYRDIPYALIPDLASYRYFDRDEIVFPMYSAMGCPYQCAFCSSPALYSKFGRKWSPYPSEDVVSHIAMVQERFGATMIYFIDDDSFVDLKHVDAIIDEIKRRHIHVKLSFRGARVNEILTMSDAFLEKLAAAGVNALHIGAESGCDRLLTLMRKNITTEQTLEANRKLARHPKITALYNFVVGYPTETLEETRMTRDHILQLIHDNPQCIVLPLNKLRPLPGTELYTLALKSGHVPPVALSEWGDVEQESAEYNPVWLTREHNQIIRMMYLSMYFIDDKIIKMSSGRSLKYVALKGLARLYRPIALYRFKHGIYQFLIEDWFYSIMKRFI